MNIGETDFSLLPITVQYGYYIRRNQMFSIVKEMYWKTAAQGIMP